MPAPLSRSDIDFLLYEWLEAERLTSRERFADHSRETFDSIMDVAAEMATEVFAPHNKKADQNPPHVAADGKVAMIDEVKLAVDEFAKAGLLASSFDESLGGVQLPMVVTRAAMAWFQAANPGSSSYSFLTMGNANLLLAHGTEEQIDTWVRPMLDGRFTGTMCLSEPDVGSSLADITTRAVPAGDGTYRISGNKMWISGGDHELTENIVHLVLAKAPGGGPGVKGISLYVVPKKQADGQANGVSLVSLNHKMGNRGTTNALLEFDGATGWLVGEEHRGLEYMFHMMNEARIGVGFLATSLGYAGYLASLEYAKTRTQGRDLTAKDPASAPVAIIEHPDVKRMLLAQKSYVEGALALGLYCSKLVDDAATAPADEAQRASLLLDVLTPIAKAWPSQWCLEANNLAIQVHGGYGYTTEFDVEQYYRDNRLNAIHEGTNGIQGLDLLGRKVVMKGGQGLAVLAQTVGDTVARAREAGGESAEYGTVLAAALQRLTDTTAALWKDRDPAVALANSSVYLEAAGHVVVAWIWLEQLLAAGESTGDLYDGKRAAARYFYRFELPKTGPQFDLLASLDRTTLDTDPAWL
ncbi:acyl-CoA dehydrogenase [Amycolatopsis silviterrae]|uniref:Acyl-CoA dehydrogenase n=1 Tax=Amycolatopsis silviterrae TaxID=1656914 RepID=A0ABW5HKW3_9PSEU